MANSNKSGNFEADDTDHAILARLQQDVRLPATTLAEDADLSPAAVRRRIERLEEVGILGGAKIDHKLLLGGSAVDAFVALKLTGHNPDFVKQTVAENPAIISGVELLGDPDAMLHVFGEDLDAIHEMTLRLRENKAVSTARFMPIVEKTPSQS